MGTDFAYTLNLNLGLIILFISDIHMSRSAACILKKDSFLSCEEFKGPGSGKLLSLYNILGNLPKL